MSGAEAVAPRRPKSASSKSDGNEILESMTVLSGRVIEAPSGNLSVSAPWFSGKPSSLRVGSVAAAIITN